MGHSVDRCIRHEVANEFEFGGAGLRVVGGNVPKGAAVKVNPVVIAVGLLAVGVVSLIIEHVGQNVDSLGDRLADQFVLSVLDEAEAAPLEYSIYEFGVFFFDVFEEFDRETAVRGDEERFGEVGGVVAVGGASWLAPVLTRADEAGGSKCPEVLANCAGGDLEGGGEFFGGCVTAAFQCNKYTALSRRGRSAFRVHYTIVAGHAVSEVSQGATNETLVG